MAFLETGAFVGLIAPGETVVIVGGLVAGQGEINIIILIGWCGSAPSPATRRASSSAGGSAGGSSSSTARGADHRGPPRAGRGLLHRHGGATILFGRFLGLVRALAPFIAGASRLPVRRFLPYDIVAAGAWATTFCLLGYIFWQSFDTVVNVAKKSALAAGTTVAVIVGAVIAYRYLRVPENRETAKRWIDTQADRPLLRPFARVLRPVYRRVILPAWRRLVPFLRFVWERVTPGQLGLELTTLLAIASVGSYLFFGLASMVEQGDRLRSDMNAFDVAARSRWLARRRAQGRHQLGALRSSCTVVLVAVVFLLSRRRITEGAVLAAGTASRSSPCTSPRRRSTAAGRPIPWCRPTARAFPPDMPLTPSPTSPSPSP